MQGLRQVGAVRPKRKHRRKPPGPRPGMAPENAQRRLAQDQRLSEARLAFTPDQLQAELVWSAGLFEGEGCIQVRADGYVILRVAMTDLDALERLQTAVGGGQILGPDVPKPGHKPKWAWTLAKQAEVAALLELWLPWLCARRLEKATEALSVLHTPRPNQREKTKVS